MDDETKLLLLPQPESKREVKIADTKYNVSTVEALKDRAATVVKSLEVEDRVVKRYEDKTQEEI